MSNRAIKKVIITGAASGIGAATVDKYLSQTDFEVVAIDLNQELLQTLHADCAEQARQRLSLLALDLTDREQCTQAFNQLIDTVKTIDHIVISHGIDRDHDITENATWDQILATNLHATQRLLSAFVNVISDGGRVVFVSSILGRAGKANNTAYVASKHALLGLTKGLALDLASRRITVNAVLPCWVETPMLLKGLEHQAALLGIPVKTLLRQIKKKIPLRALITAADVADTILFLTSPSASMITAQGIVIDGGFGCGT
ncbi:MAG: 3-hydroxybutyrate dehydrogenase/3-oxoacyl-[acyl-carrier protein] reductase [Pseudohongiellaceae bacterium]